MTGITKVSKVPITRFPPSVDYGIVSLGHVNRDDTRPIIIMVPRNVTWLR
eukprot:CAMPEP_0195280084 /NCGR_PEP_ID=MMETSP0706-20130129/20864_1 /TAXON_ID=33640 /ORGANISM="Asterionellopsis glacialis, Strain CCMP134" /LENGTH=49 /DNA_ID=CAMNT_0040338737 /DNA_START=258 /DNA_END=407 /DNA_ORIENTATION=-